MAIITLIERSQIELMQHHTIQYIAATLGRSRISIRHELHRCPEGDYCAIIAQDHADTCRHRCGRHSILTPKLKRMVTEKLNLGWSPEMVGYAVHCAPHTIYHWIYQRQVDFQPSQLFDHGKRHKRRQDLRSRYNQAVGTSIEIRSESANRRTEKGHLEMDTVRGGRGSKAAVLTIVDRVTRLMATTKLENLSQNAVLKGFARLMVDFPGPVRSVTVDHGKEFSCDQALTKRYRIPVYFCHAYHPNERGTNERFNRELRYYFPKGTQFDQVSETDIQHATALINNKPRKCLRWQTPVQAVSKPLSRW
ncbi:IS30 family transposase [Lacticaseibacillus paracasei]|uniref:IS30 family transposase n=1 Tax=Lacticaseibacillus paracasei TaxID=1597 RepID=UPI0012EB0A19|nr:IS30 family transposase [Lacticaseibacillus paracasei]